MALEDLAMFRAVQGSTVFYPSDAVSMERAVELAANTKGICFIRSSRPATPVVHGNNDVFQVGKAKVSDISHCSHSVVVEGLVIFVLNLFGSFRNVEMAIMRLSEYSPLVCIV